MSSSENKRAPNKPILFATTKKTGANKKSPSLSKSPKNNIKRIASDIYFDVPGLHSKQQKVKQEKLTIDSKNNSKDFHSLSSPHADHSSLKKNSSSSQLNDVNQRELIEDESYQTDMNSYYSQEQSTEAHQTNQDEDDGILPDEKVLITDSMNAKLGKKIRKIYNWKSDNDSIIFDIKTFVKFIRSIQGESISSNDCSIESFIDHLKKRIHENKKLREKNELLEIQLRKVTNQSSNFDIFEIIKSFYTDCADPKQIIRLFERDLSFSKAIRNFFKENNNDEAILTTIQSNKELADDNNIIIELTSQLQLLRRAAEINRDESFEKMKNELNEKDSKIFNLTQTMNELKNQIENGQKELKEERKKREIEIQQIQSLKENDQLNHLTQIYENQITKLQEELLETKNSLQAINIKQKVLIDQQENEINQIKNDNEKYRISFIRFNKENNQQKNIIEQKEKEIDKLKDEVLIKESNANQFRNDLFNQQSINEQIQKENTELKIFIKNCEDIKDNEILYLKKELLSSLDKQKKMETQLIKLKEIQCQNKS